ncbi:glycogen debranching protein GlgX [Telmatocola sphagniphila]|uniref:Glycogen debranching protein GlgX n=1 Tax=Telmatocola sphagniphila TaxID=1123043 RepID=A0A8E6B8D6_9BACT|nr:glycogen debranching protein GlgX [Telmatocola sphagniphila]QVL33021.1 glycogen debranching protein GlgX [Telmatocola sphagniphila]
MADTTPLSPETVRTTPDTRYAVARGRAMPLGVSTSLDGINFCLLCRHGVAVTLVLLPLEGSEIPLAEIELHPQFHRTGDHWHVLVKGLPLDFRYGWRVSGPDGNGHRFNPKRILLDPAATILSEGAVWAGTCETDRERTGRRSVFHRSPRYDWADDHPPRIPQDESIIYELHVRGFTCHPSSKVQNSGTFSGLIEKIPYLQWLGVTAVELLPIHEFDECDCPFINPETKERNRNFWGYNTLAFAAPKAAYAARANEYGQLAEFRDLVKAFHAAGIEVILDVVFNHTGEGDDRGRTYSFRGLDNSLYYLMSPDGKKFLNFTGCGNTLNCNHPVVRELIMNCLRHWVGNMHVDGFRFDLASIFGRDKFGNVLLEPPILEMITEDGILADCKLIAEPWDAAGLYQVGHFPFGHRWQEWNGKYRDDVRRFWRGDGLAGLLASRICGSADVYEWNQRSPLHSINYVTCHDGFTLNDLVSYNRKHNLANGENNYDGMDENYSWNCGEEGPSNNPEINHLRIRQAKNLMATMLLSQGVPMILAGDEFLRTQKGNNNAWCQDNEISWVDWTLAEKNKDFLRFTREMIHLRKRHPVLHRPRFFKGEITSDWSRFGNSVPNNWRGEKISDIVWHGLEPNLPNFNTASNFLAFTLDGRMTGRETDPEYMVDSDFYVAMNASNDICRFKIPPSPTRRKWRRVADTSLESPLDFVAENTGPEVPPGSIYSVPPHAILILVSEG